MASDEDSCGEVYEHGRCEVIEPEPKVGTRQTARDGSQWVKVRMIGERAWADALCSAIFDARMVGKTTERDLEGMGYERIKGGVK